MKLKRMSVALGIGGLALALTGCVVTSVYPFYFAKDVVFDPTLLGVWVNKDSTKEQWKFEREDAGASEDAGARAYRFTYTDGQKSSVAQAHLFKLQDETFLDLFTSECGEAGMFPMIPSHVLVRVTRTGSALRLAVLDYDWLGKLLEQKPKALRHHVTLVGRDRWLVLTAGTKELQRFVLRHLHTKAAWEEETELQSMSAPPATKN